jgi:hypothetical protein
MEFENRWTPSSGFFMAGDCCRRSGFGNKKSCFSIRYILICGLALSSYGIVNDLWQRVGLPHNSSNEANVPGWPAEKLRES